jgi:hypothetical protein
LAPILTSPNNLTHTGHEKLRTLHVRLRSYEFRWSCWSTQRVIMASLPPTTVTTIANISTQIGVSTSPTVFSYAATTQYTPPAECLQNTYIWGTGSGADIQIAPDYVPSCWPAPWPSLSGSLSPAFCPAGYTIASLSAYLGRFISDVDNASAGIGSYTETHLTCCPAYVNFIPTLCIQDMIANIIW